MHDTMDRTILIGPQPKGIPSCAIEWLVYCYKATATDDDLPQWAVGQQLSLYHRLGQ